MAAAGVEECPIVWGPLRERGEPPSCEGKLLQVVGITSAKALGQEPTRKLVRLQPHVQRKEKRK